jgi:hypothetical protein
VASQGHPVVRGRRASHHLGSSPWRFTGGTIKRDAVDVSGDSYIDLEREAMAVLARE